MSSRPDPASSPTPPVPVKRKGGVLKKTGCGCLVAMLVVFLAGWLFGDAMLRSSVIGAASDALGVPVSIDSLDLYLLGRPSIVLNDVKVGTAPEIITLDQVTVKLDSLSGLLAGEYIATIDGGGLRVEVTPSHLAEGGDLHTILRTLTAEGDGSGESVAWALRAINLRDIHISLPGGDAGGSKISLGSYSAAGLASPELAHAVGDPLWEVDGLVVTDPLGELFRLEEGHVGFSDGDEGADRPMLSLAMKTLRLNEQYHPDRGMRMVRMLLVLSQIGSALPQSVPAEDASATPPVTLAQMLPVGGVKKLNLEDIELSMIAQARDGKTSRAVLRFDHLRSGNATLAESGSVALSALSLKDFAVELTGGGNSLAAELGRARLDNLAAELEGAVRPGLTLTVKQPSLTVSDGKSVTRLNSTAVKGAERPSLRLVLAGGSPDEVLRIAEFALADMAINVPLQQGKGPVAEGIVRDLAAHWMGQLGFKREEDRPVFQGPNMDGPEPDLTGPGGPKTRGTDDLVLGKALLDNLAVTFTDAVGGSEEMLTRASLTSGGLASAALRMGDDPRIELNGVRLAGGKLKVVGPAGRLCDGSLKKFAADRIATPVDGQMPAVSLVMVKAFFALGKEGNPSRIGCDALDVTVGPIRSGEDVVVDSLLLANPRVALGITPRGRLASVEYLRATEKLLMNYLPGMGAASSAFPRERIDVSSGRKDASAEGFSINGITLKAFEIASSPELPVLTIDDRSGVGSSVRLGFNLSRLSLLSGGNTIRAADLSLIANREGSGGALTCQNIALPLGLIDGDAAKGVVSLKAFALGPIPEAGAPPLGLMVGEVRSEVASLQPLRITSVLVRRLRSMITADANAGIDLDKALATLLQPVEALAKAVQAEGISPAEAEALPRESATLAPSQPQAPMLWIDAVCIENEPHHLAYMGPDGGGNATLTPGVISLVDVVVRPGGVVAEGVRTEAISLLLEPIDDRALRFDLKDLLISGVDTERLSRGQGELSVSAVGGHLAWVNTPAAPLAAWVDTQVRLSEYSSRRIFVDQLSASGFHLHPTISTEDEVDLLLALDILLAPVEALGAGDDDGDAVAATSSRSAAIAPPSQKEMGTPLVFGDVLVVGKEWLVDFEQSSSKQKSVEPIRYAVTTPWLRARDLVVGGSATGQGGHGQVAMGAWLPGRGEGEAPGRLTLALTEVDLRGDSMALSLQADGDASALMSSLPPPILAKDAAPVISEELGCWVLEVPVSLAAPMLSKYIGAKDVTGAGHAGVGVHGRVRDGQVHLETDLRIVRLQAKSTSKLRGFGILFNLFAEQIAEMLRKGMDINIPSAATTTGDLFGELKTTYNKVGIAAGAAEGLLKGKDRERVGALRDIFGGFRKNPDKALENAGRILGKELGREKEDKKDGEKTPAPDAPAPEPDAKADETEEPKAEDKIRDAVRNIFNR